MLVFALFLISAMFKKMPSFLGCNLFYKLTNNESNSELTLASSGMKI